MAIVFSEGADLTDLRQPPPAAPFARGTRVDAERSRLELESFLADRGASDFVVLQDAASARVRFALYGSYFELVLPLPDPQSRAFSHTASGRPRASAAQHRAYNQAMREKWRTLLFVTKAKLHAVESGISSLDREFSTGYLPEAAWPAAPGVETVERLAPPRGGPWRRVSRTVVGAFGAGLLVPASALSAFAMPDAAVDRVAGLVWSENPTLFTHTVPASASARRPSDLSASGGTVVLTASGAGGELAYATRGPADTTAPAPHADGHPSGGREETPAGSPVRGGGTPAGGDDPLQPGNGDAGGSGNAGNDGNAYGHAHGNGNGNGGGNGNAGGGKPATSPAAPAGATGNGGGGARATGAQGPQGAGAEGGKAKGKGPSSRSS